MKSYQLHTAQNRRSMFQTLLPPIWLETELLRLWVVAEPSLILQTLRSPLAFVPSLSEMLTVVEKRHGFSFPNVAYACDVLPLLVEDRAHPSVRRGFATFLADRLAELETQLPALAKGSLMPLARPGTVDVVAEVVRPFLGRVFSILLQCDFPPEYLSARIGDILSFNTNLALLRSLESRIAGTLALLRSTSASERDVAWKFTCLVFGLGSLAMMLAEGTVAAVRDASGSGARLPAFPVETGVPVTFRRAREDLKLGGCLIGAGDLLRLQLQCLGYSRLEEERKFIFGAGAHSCVGKQLSLRIWEQFRREFDRLGLQARLGPYQLSPSHFIILHEKVELEIL